MDFVAANYELIITVLGLAATALGILHLRTRAALEQVRADGVQQQTQLNIIQQQIIAGSKREEAWQQTLKELSTDIKGAMRELVTEMKISSSVTAVSVDNNTTTNNQLRDVMEVQIMRLNTLESTVMGGVADMRKLVPHFMNLYEKTANNVDHVVLTVEAIRDRVLNSVTNDLILKRLDEILILTKAKEIQNQKETAYVEVQLPPFILDSALAVVPESVAAGTSSGQSTSHDNTNSRNADNTQSESVGDAAGA